MRGFEATGALTRFYLRRDWLIIIVWTALTAVLYWAQAVSIVGLYATQEEFDLAAKMMEQNAAFIAMAGPARELNTIGGQVAWQMSAFGAMLAAGLSMIIIGRHTRTEEETGRDELLRSTNVGRYGPTTAATIVAIAANVLLAVFITGILVAADLEFVGSLNLGLAAAATGLVFMGIMLVFAQLSESARAAYGFTGAILGASYLLRAIGDVAWPWVSWLSPIGWGQAMRAFADEIWWPLLISLIATIIFVWFANFLLNRRDIGGSYWPTRPGSAKGGALLGSIWGLSWVLQRGTFFGWLIAAPWVGIAFGSLGDEVGALVGGDSTISEMFGIDPETQIDSFYSLASLMIAMILGAYAISSALRMKGEEAAGRTENLLATPISRLSWFLSHAVITVIGSFILLLSAAVGMALSFWAMTGETDRIAPMISGTVLFAPALFVLSGVAWLLWGWRSRLGSLAWLVFGFMLVASLFGSILQFPDWLIDFSVFNHVPTLPSEDFSWGSTVALIGIGFAMLATSYGFLRRRDVA